MSSVKLNQSLDDIVTTNRSANRGRGGRTRRGRPAPVGGVKKTVAKPAGKPSGKIGTKAEASIPAAGGASKVIVSNLPIDVTQAQIKEYFGKIAGPIKSVSMAYGPNGVSRGIATITFVKRGLGNKALEANGLRIDQRPIKVEAIIDASQVPVQEAKSLSDRVSKPKVQPKLAKPTDDFRSGARGRGARGRGATRGRNAGRGKPKTAEQLDAEMTDYFVAPTTGDAAATTGAPGAVVGGDDLGMDEVS